MNKNYEIAKKIAYDHAMQLSEQGWNLYDLWIRKSKDNKIYATTSLEDLENLDAKMNDIGYRRTDDMSIDEIKVIYDKAGYDIVLSKNNCLGIDLDDIKSDIHAIVYAYEYIG